MLIVPAEVVRDLAFRGRLGFFDLEKIEGCAAWPLSFGSETSGIFTPYT
jgi:hypothetical protein